MDSVGGGVEQKFSEIHILWGGGVVAEIFRDPYSVGAEFFPLTAVTDPKFVFFPVNYGNRP